MNDKFDKSLNMDTATPEKIAATNAELVDYMETTGENTAAKQIDYLIQNQKGPVNSTNTDPNSFKLLTVNKKILLTLEKIYRDMFDEQDTTIKHTSTDTADSTLVSQTVSTEADELADSDSDSDSFNMFRRGASSSKKEKAKKKAAKDKRKAAKEKAKNKSDKKTSKDTKKQPKRKGAKKTSKLAKKVISKGLGKGAGLMAAKAIPGIGLAVMAGMAIYDGINGWQDAGASLGIDEKDLTTANKASSAAGGVISGLTFGLADADETSQGINNLFGGNKAIEKYQEMGIIDHDTFGDSDIVSWVKMATLAPAQIQEIIDIDDWSNEDAQKLSNLKQTLLSAPNSDILTVDEQPTKVEPVQYTMKSVPSIPNAVGAVGAAARKQSLNPSDYKSSELFNFYKVKESDFDELEPNTLHNLKGMGAEYLDLYGEKIQINSAYRSIEEQTKLKEKLGNKAAAPGKSMHNYGLAIDMNTVNAEKSIESGLFQKYGFIRPVPGETWHVEPKGINRAAIRENGFQQTAEKDTSKVIAINNLEETETTPQEKREADRSDNVIPVTQEIANATTANAVQKVDNENKVEPIKTSSLQKTDNSISKIEDLVTSITPVESDKSRRKVIIERTSANLSAQTAEYDKSIQTEQIAAVLTPVINQSINNNKPEPEKRSLSVFSTT